MATSNAYLIMSESMFEQAGSSTTDNDPASAYGTTSCHRAGAIEVLDFSFKIEQVGSEPPGRPRSVERIERSEFEFTKAADSRSPKLFRYCCEGTYIGIAELQIFGPTSVPYICYRMSYVHVSSFSPSGGSELATERIGLKFGEMGVKFNNAGIGLPAQGNSRSGSVTAKWSWVMEIPTQVLDPLTRIQGLKGTEF